MLNNNSYVYVAASKLYAKPLLRLEQLHMLKYNLILCYHSILFYVRFIIIDLIFKIRYLLILLHKIEFRRFVAHVM